MKIITLETLKSMPSGTVFCKVDRWGNFQDDIRILTGRFNEKSSLNGVMTLYPWIVSSTHDKNHELIKGKDIQTKWPAFDTGDHDYSENQLYSVFSRAEVKKMIKTLRWALSDLENDFDMDEILE